MLSQKDTRSADVFTLATCFKSVFLPVLFHSPSIFCPANVNLKSSHFLGDGWKSMNRLCQHLCDYASLEGEISHLAALRGIPGTFHSEHKQVRFKNNAHLETKVLSLVWGFPCLSTLFLKDYCMCGRTCVISVWTLSEGPLRWIRALGSPSLTRGVR